MVFLRPAVAQVLLVAAPLRQRDLAPLLRVETLAVDYALGLVTPDALSGTSSWDVVVVDGESLVDSRERARVLRQVAAEDCSTTLYVCSRLAFETEVEEASCWADDVVCSGWSHPERVARRVQAIALAPWRRSMALRRRAEQAGDSRLRVLPPPEPAEPTSSALRGPMRLERSLPFVLAERAWRLGGETPELVSRAFHAGRRVGVAAVKDRVLLFCDAVAGEIEQTFRALSPEVVEELERDAYDDDAFGSAVVGTRYRASVSLLEVVRSRMDAVVRDELALIARHQASAEGVERW